MNRETVKANLIRIRQARRKWEAARAKFNSDVDAAMLRLINEAAVNYMSAEEVATYSGFTVRAVRAKMRHHGLTGRGRKLLAKQAATTLVENANILGIEPGEMDLMSPLAYLPAGSALRKGAEANAVSNAAAEFPETDPDEKALADLFKAFIGGDEPYVDADQGDLVLDGRLYNITPEQAALVNKYRFRYSDEVTD